MNVSKLEAFLKEVGYKQAGDHLTMDYNDFKCGYCTAEHSDKHERHMRWPNHWVSPEQKAAAFVENEIWKLCSWMGDKGELFKCAKASAPGPAMAAFGTIDQEIIDQAAFVKKMFDKHMLGEYSHASYGFETGQRFSSQLKKGGPWVNQLSTVKQHMEEHAQEGNTTDWVSDESKEKAYEQNFVWHVHYYPHTPIGFYRVHAATLQELVDFLENEEPEKV